MHSQRSGTGGISLGCFHGMMRNYALVRTEAKSYGQTSLNGIQLAWGVASISLFFGWGTEPHQGESGFSNGPGTGGALRTAELCKVQHRFSSHPPAAACLPANSPPPSLSTEPKHQHQHQQRWLEERSNDRGVSARQDSGRF